MADSLLHQIDGFRSVSIIGMCKNAGKTTVLNRLIREAAAAGHKLALTSIGRDGESQDLVTGTKKPEIYVPSGTLIATASELALHSCDVTKEILDTTSIYTPMGEVVLLRACSDGYVQLAGPSMTGQLAQIRDRFFDLGAQKVLIDGALSRKSLCSRRVSDATILCTGASYHKHLPTVVEETAFRCRVLTLPETENAALRDLAAQTERETVLLTGDGFHTLTSSETLEDGLRKTSAEAVFFGGALTDNALKPLLMSSVSIQGLRFVVRDGSHILLRQDTVEKIYRRGGQLQVIDSVNLVALTVNPFSAYGTHFDAKELRQRMAEATRLPVYDVMEGDAAWN